MLKCTMWELSGRAKVVLGWYITKCLRTLKQIQADTPDQIVCTDLGHRHLFLISLTALTDNRITEEKNVVTLRYRLARNVMIMM